MTQETVIEISNVWKIFGARAEDALRAIRDRGLTKAEVLAEFNAVVGVADVTLDVKRGEIFCIMGLSGSGKSTLVRHFNRLLEPTAGKIEIEGTDVMALGPRELQQFRNQKIGMVFQNFALLPHPDWTIFGNLAWTDGELDTFPTSDPVKVRDPLDRLARPLGEAPEEVVRERPHVLGPKERPERVVLQLERVGLLWQERPEPRGVDEPLRSGPASVELGHPSLALVAGVAPRAGEDDALAGHAARLAHRRRGGEAGCDTSNCFQYFRDP